MSQTYFHKLTQQNKTILIIIEVGITTIIEVEMLEIMEAEIMIEMIEIGMIEIEIETDKEREMYEKDQGGVTDQETDLKIVLDKDMTETDTIDIKEFEGEVDRAAETEEEIAGMMIIEKSRMNIILHIKINV
jgi:hypothetical protein